MGASDLLKLRYNQLLDLWHSFCESHTKLYELTCEEYSYLLKSNIEKIESTLERKEVVVNAIKELELVRIELIKDINSEKLFNMPVQNIAGLLKSMQSYEQTLNLNGLERYNKLLINVIENIQEQNKKNQNFLNKAIHNIQELRQEFTQNKSYQTYDSKGLARKNQVSAR